MASGNGPASQGPVGEPDAPPSRRDLASWWRNFKKNTRKEEEKVPPAPPKPQGIFGVPLQTSIIYANVAISLFDAEGRSFIYGYVPIVVAKCGVFLKDKATDVEGIFRLAGSERRIKDLQAIFNSPERYGKGLDWTGYNVHDAANVLRRYFRELPEPIIPLDFYERLRAPLKNHQAQAVGQMDHQEPTIGDFDLDAAIKNYQRLITELPPLNRQLLLYILDLLAVFASKSDVNLMTAPNLSAIFQPGVLSHPKDAMSPKEYRLSQDVLIFLIENQDHFIVGMQGTAADEKTIQEIQEAGNAQKSANSKPGQVVARSASNASAGAESLRRQGGVRRNVSVSSRRSRHSGNTPSPVTPPPDSPYAAGKAGGVHRSNTVPSRKSGSPALQNTRFQREKSNEASAIPDRTASNTTAARSGSAVAPDAAAAQGPSLSEAITGQRPAQAPSNQRTSGRMSPHLRPIKDRHRGTSADRQLKMDMPPAATGRVSPSGTPSRERTFSHFFKQSPTPEGDGRRPNKLQKKRPDLATSQYDGRYQTSGTSGPPSPAYHQAQFGGYSHRSSNSQLDSRRADLSPEPTGRMPETYDEPIEELPPPVMQKESQQGASRSTETPAQSNVAQQQSVPVQQPFAPQQQQQPIVPHQQPIAPSQPTGPPQQPASQSESTNLKDNANRVSAATLKPSKSPAGSVTSRSTGNEYSSSHDNAADDGDIGEKKEKKHHRWKLSRSIKPDHKDHPSQYQAAAASGTSSRMGSTHGGAEQSTTSVGSSSNLPRKSFTDESMPSSTQQQTVPSAFGGVGGIAPGETDNGAAGSGEKRGLSGWIKGKLHEKKEKDAEKERTKSPPAGPRSEQSASSRQSSSGVAPSMEGSGVTTSGKRKSMEQLPEEGRYAGSSPSRHEEKQYPPPQAQ